MLHRLAYDSKVGLQLQGFLKDKVGAVGGYGEPQAFLVSFDQIRQEAAHIVVAERMGGADAYHLVDGLFVAQDYLLGILFKGKELLALEVEGFPHWCQIYLLIYYI